MEWQTQPLVIVPNLSRVGPNERGCTLGCVGVRVPPPRLSSTRWVPSDRDRPLGLLPRENSRPARFTLQHFPRFCFIPLDYLIARLVLATSLGLSLLADTIPQRRGGFLHLGGLADHLMEGGMDVPSADVWSSAPGGPCRRDEHPGGGAGVRTAPRHGAQDAEVLGATGVSTGRTAPSTEARPLHRE